MKRKEGKGRFGGKWRGLLWVGVFLGVLGIARLGLATKMEEQSLLDQPVEAVGEVGEEGPQVGFSAPGFVSEDVWGKAVSLSDFRGQRPVLLVFWTTWCGFCAQELPVLKAFTQKHQGEVEVVVVGSGEPRKAIADYMKKEEVNFVMLLDERKEIWGSYWVRGTPSHFLIDKEGIIATLRPGLASEDDLETMLRMVGGQDL